MKPRTIGQNFNLSKAFYSTKAQLKAAEIANEGITLEYDSSNTRTTLEVIQSRTFLLEARIAHAKAEKDFFISQFELAKQIGTLSKTLSNKLNYSKFKALDKKNKCVHLTH